MPERPLLLRSKVTRWLVLLFPKPKGIVPVTLLPFIVSAMRLESAVNDLGMVEVMELLPRLRRCSVLRAPIQEGIDEVKRLLPRFIVCIMGSRQSEVGMSRDRRLFDTSRSDNWFSLPNDIGSVDVSELNCKWRRLSCDMDPNSVGIGALKLLESKYNCTTLVNLPNDVGMA